MVSDARHSRRPDARTGIRVAILSVLVGTVAVLTARADIRSYPQVGRLETAYTLGSGGFSVGGGYLQLDDRRLPRSGRLPIVENLTVGGVALEREVASFTDGGLVPVSLGFAAGDATDLYLRATTFSGTSEKRVNNFYGVPDSVLDEQSGEDRLRFDRVYDQPIFDVGIGIKHQLKREVGDGLPAVAFGLEGRFGYTADDHGGFQDSTPYDGFPDYGITAYLAASRSFGDYLSLHGLAALAGSKKLDAQMIFGGAMEYSLIPNQLVLIADYASRRDVNGFEYTDLGHKLTFGIRYELSTGASVQLLSAPGGHLLVNFTRLGQRVEAISPVPPQFDDQLF